MGSMTVDYRCITFFNRSWVIKQNNLCSEVYSFFRWISCGLSSDISPFYFICLKFDIKSNIVSRSSRIELFVMHLNRFNLAFGIPWSKCYICFFLQSSCFYSAYYNSSMPLYLVYIINWNS